MTARRPWWKRKRWWAVAALWLAVTYPASDGPAFYALKRDWISFPTFLAVWGPVPDLFGEDRINAYEHWLGRPCRQAPRL